MTDMKVWSTGERSVNFKRVWILGVGKRLYLRVGLTATVKPKRRLVGRSSWGWSLGLDGQVGLGPGLGLRPA